LLRDLPLDLAAKLKVAASLHGTSMKGYLLEILQTHIDELEKKGVVLKLPKGKSG
jgi:plasmid stability protein